MTKYLELTAEHLSTQLFTVVPEDLVDTSQSYKHYLPIAKAVYDRLQAAVPGLDYRNYQYEYAASYTARKLNVCGAVQGLGKSSISGITIATAYQNIKDLRPGTVHIVAPSVMSASTRWLPDLLRIPDLEDCVELIKTEKQLLTSTKPIWVYHMDFLKRKSKTYKTMYKAIYKAKRMPKFLIVDEVHHYQEGTKRTNALAFIRRKAKRVLALSGTLSDGRLDLIQDTCRLVYKGNWPYTRKSLKATFGVHQVVKSSFLEGGEDQVNTRYLNQLSVSKIPLWFETIQSKVHRVSASNPEIMSCVTYPTPTYHFESIDMSVEQDKAYKTLVKAYRQELEVFTKYSQSATNLAAAFKVMSPLLKVSNLPGDYGVPNKAKRCLDIVAEGATRGDKTIVFTDRNDVGFFLHNYLQENLESNVVRMYAHDENEKPKTMGDDLREKVMSSFLYDSDVAAGIFSIRLASESIDLTSAKTVIFYDLPWQVIKILQATSRAVRPGSIHKEVNVHFLNNVGTIDFHRSQLMQQKVIGSNLLLDFDVESSRKSDMSPIDAIKRIFQ